MSKRSVLLASNYNAWPEAFNSQAYAFINVIQSLETAEVVAPKALQYTSGRALRPTFRYLAEELIYRSASQVRRGLGLPRYATMEPFTVDRDYDLFFYMCQFPIDLSSLSKIRGWRKRSGKAVAVILETWSHQLHTAAAELRLLDEFDHVFVLIASSIPTLAKYTKTPCTFLPTASDCLLATPFPDAPDRTIDVYSIGRRSPAAHEQLIEIASSDPHFHYVYDVSRHGAVTSWRDSRLLSANSIKRSKFFVAFDHTVVDKGGIPKNFSERAISTRYFEGAAGGAVMIGSAPDCPEFQSHFDWEDAVIELPPDSDAIRQILEDLSAQPERLASISRKNATESLQRHDWAHRWDAILSTLGLERTVMLHQRLERLQRLADDADRGLRRQEAGPGKHLRRV